MVSTDAWVPCSAELQLGSKSLIHAAENFTGPPSVPTDPKKLLEFICDPCQNRTGWDILACSGWERGQIFSSLMSAVVVDPVVRITCQRPRSLLLWKG